MYAIRSYYAENNAEAVKVEASGARRHHFDSAAGQTESQRPQRSGPGPVNDLVKTGCYNVITQRS